MNRLNKQANQDEKILYNDFINKLQIAYDNLSIASKDWIELEKSDNIYLDNLIHELPFHVPFQEIVDKIGIYAMRLKTKN